MALLLGSLYYPLAGIKTKPETPASGPTLDGLEFVRQYNPGEYAAIDWLKQNAPPDAAIVEAVGEWGDWGLVSRSTGLPTIVNWLGHQRQWRGGWERFESDRADLSRALRDQYFDERAEEVERIYATLDPCGGAAHPVQVRHRLRVRRTPRARPLRHRGHCKVRSHSRPRIRLPPTATR